MLNFEKILEPGEFAQVGFVVNNLQEAKEAFAKLFGVDVPENVSGGDYEITKATTFGKPSPDVSIQMAFFDLSDGVALELIEPNEVSSVWRDHLEKYGEGIHHIAFRVKDIDMTAAKLKEIFGAVEESQGLYGDASGRYMYLNTQKILKCRLELLQSF